MVIIILQQMDHKEETQTFKRARAIRKKILMKEWTEMDKEQEAIGRKSWEVSVLHCTTIINCRLYYLACESRPLFLFSTMIITLFTIVTHQQQTTSSKSMRQYEPKVTFLCSYQWGF